jgi:hypothetical protein
MVTKGGLKSPVSKGGLKFPVFNKGKRMVTVHSINKGSVKKTMHMIMSLHYVIVLCIVKCINMSSYYGM